MRFFFFSHATRWVGSSFWLKIYDDGTLPRIAAAVTEAQAQQAEAQGVVRAKVQFLDPSDRAGDSQGPASETKQGSIVARLGNLKQSLGSEDLAGATGQVGAWLRECDGGGTAKPVLRMVMVVVLATVAPARDPVGVAWFRRPW